MIEKKKNPFVQAVLYLVLIIITIATLLPLIWMLSASFKLDSEVFSVPIKWIPETFHFENYAQIWEKIPFGLFTFNKMCIRDRIDAHRHLIHRMPDLAQLILRFFNLRVEGEVVVCDTAYAGVKTADWMGYVGGYQNGENDGEQNDRGKYDQKNEDKLFAVPSGHADLIAGVQGQPCGLQFHAFTLPCFAGKTECLSLIHI